MQRIRARRGDRWADNYIVSGALWVDLAWHAATPERATASHHVTAQNASGRLAQASKSAAIASTVAASSQPWARAVVDRPCSWATWNARVATHVGRGARAVDRRTGFGLLEPRLEQQPAVVASEVGVAAVVLPDLHAQREPALQQRGVREQTGWRRSRDRGCRRCRPAATHGAPRPARAPARAGASARRGRTRHRTSRRQTAAHRGRRPRSAASSRHARRRAHVRACTCAGWMSTPTTGPGATCSARPSVIEPGPQPTSSTRIPASRWGMKNAACRVAVRAASSASKAALPCWE